MSRIVEGSEETPSVVGRALSNPVLVQRCLHCKDDFEIAFPREGNVCIPHERPIDRRLQVPGLAPRFHMSWILMEFDYHGDLTVFVQYL